MQDRVLVDFNSGFDRTDSDGKYFRQPNLGTTGSLRDLARLGIEPTEGLPLKVYMEDMDVDGQPGALIGTGVVIRGPYGWLVEVADDDTHWVACD